MTKKFSRKVSDRVPHTEVLNYSDLNSETLWLLRDNTRNTNKWAPMPGLAVGPWSLLAHNSYQLLLFVTQFQKRLNVSIMITFKLM